MPITYKKTVAVLDGVCAIEDAEILYHWLQDHPNAKVNLKTCTHLHTALLQVLMQQQVDISLMPQQQSLRDWLHPLLQTQ